VRLVGEADEDGVPVGLGVDRDTADARVLARADDADGDLATVGDEDLLEPFAGALANGRSPLEAGGRLPSRV
jgi:hypothetical protein